MSTYELAVELDEIQANRLTSLLQEREKLVDGMYEKLESHPKADKKDKTYVQQLLPMPEYFTRRKRTLRGNWPTSSLLEYDYSSIF